MSCIDTFHSVRSLAIQSIHFRLMSAVLLFIPLLFSGMIQAQTFEWATFGSGTGRDSGQKVTTDQHGNVYLTGYFGGKAFFSETSIEGEGLFDVFLAKYAPWGELLWIRNAGGVQNDEGYGIGIDSKGFIYVTGYFTAIASFGKAHELVRLTSGGSTDIFLAKYDPDGNLIWAKKAGGTGEDQAFGLAIDIYDNIFITGYFSNRCYFENKTAVSQGSTDVFIARYDTDGNCQWVETFGGAGLDKSFSVAVDSAGNSYITGFFYYTVLFSNSGDTLRADGLSSDIFICKYLPDGTLAHVERAGGYYNDAAFGIAVDKEKAVIITGYFLEEIEFDTVRLLNHRYNDIFVAKYDSNFRCEWALREGGFLLDMGMDVTVDRLGNIYVTGMYDSVAFFSGRTVQSVDYYDVFVSKYSGKGALLWMRSAGRMGSDIGRAITVRDDGSIYVTGYYTGNSLFGSIEAPLSKELDMFLFKIMQQPVLSVKDFSHESHFYVYPNPSEGAFFIELNEPIAEAAQLTVYDISGKIIMRQNVSAPYGNKIPVMLDVNSGVYLLRIETRKKTMTSRVAVVR